MAVIMAGPPKRLDAAVTTAVEFRALAPAGDRRLRRDGRADGQLQDGIQGQGGLLATAVRGDFNNVVGPSRG